MTPLDTGLAALDSYIYANKSYPGALVIRARIRASLRVYDRFWSDPGLENNNHEFTVLGAEELLTGPVTSLATGKATDYTAAGLLDVRIKDRNNLHGILDHKNLADAFESEDIEHLHIDGQPNQYAWLEHLNGVRINFAIWDVLCKTSHRLYQEKTTTRKPSKKEPNGAVTVTPAETLEAFEERLVEVFSENPKKYFARERIVIQKSNVIEHAQELYAWTRLLDSAKKTGNHLRNTEACFEYNRPCEYLGLCSGRTNMLDPEKWERARTTHAELDLPIGIDPALVITNSRIKVFKSCMRKHDFKYNLGLRRVGKPVEEPLYLGSASHKALEAYWLQLGKVSKGE